MIIATYCKNEERAISFDKSTAKGVLRNAPAHYTDK